MARFGFDLLYGDGTFENDWVWNNEWIRDQPTKVYRGTDDPPPNGALHYVHGIASVTTPRPNLKQWLSSAPPIVFPGILYQVDANVYTPSSANVMVYLGSHYIGGLNNTTLKVQGTWSDDSNYYIIFEFQGYGYSNIDNVLLREVLPPLPKPKIDSSLAGQLLVGKGLAA